MISRSVGVSRDAITDYLTRFKVAEISWPLPLEIDDAELECPRRSNFDPPCRLNFDPGLVAGIA